jgi:tartrate dehydrogenase/decarboxylase/D-malate dehydrogenase
VPLGERAAGKAVIAAIEEVLVDDSRRTRDLGGSATTSVCGQAIADAVR